MGTSKGVSSENYQKALAIRPEFDFKVDDFIGEICISGLVFPYNSVFCPLDKIWSSVRKRIQDAFNISVTALFRLEPEEKMIHGKLLLNCASYEDDPLLLKKFNALFKDTFPLQVSILEKALDSFLLDAENGYAAYCDYLESFQEDKVDPDVCDEMLNRFLFSVNLKTEKDEKRKKKLKEATASTPAPIKKK